MVRKIVAGTPAGAPIGEETFGYDPDGRLVAAANAHVTVTRSFDAEGCLLSETQAHADGTVFVLENVFDEAGDGVQRRTDGTLGAAHEVAFAYDLLDQVVAVRIDGAPPMEIRRDALGLMVSQTLAPGVDAVRAMAPTG